MKPREEVEKETRDLNKSAKLVADNYCKLQELWQKDMVPMQHRIAFIESVKILDMKMMAQFFLKELADFETKQAAVLNCMQVITQREKCLQDIMSLNIELDKVLQATPQQDALERVLEAIEGKLRELRSLAIRAVELIVLWRDQFRYLALIGSKQRTIRKRRA